MILNINQMGIYLGKISKELVTCAKKLNKIDTQLSKIYVKALDN